MKKATIGVGLAVIAGAGVETQMTAQAAEMTTQEQASTIQTQTDSKQATNKQEQVNQQKATVQAQQNVVSDAQEQKDQAKEALEQANTAVNNQQQVVNNNHQNVINAEKDVKDKEYAVNEAQKVVDEATPEAINNARKKVNTDTKALTEQQQAVDQAQTAVDDQQKVVDDKSKETNAAKTENDKDKQSVSSAEKDLKEKQELSDKAEAEKAKAEAEKIKNETDVTNKQAAENTAKTQMEQAQAAAAQAKEAVTTSIDKLNQAKEDTANKQTDVIAKDQVLKEKKEAVQGATKTLADSKEELKGYKGINLPAKFTPDYYKKLSDQEKQAMEKEAQEINKVFPENKADKAKENEMINVKNPTAAQKKHMSEYVVGLINDIRKKFGLQTLRISDQAIKFAWDNAKHTNSQEFGHDVDAINQAAKENGFKEYPGQNLYEDLSGGYFEIINGKVSMLNFEKAARQTIVNMLMDDERLLYSHLDSLLKSDKTNMAVSISGDFNDITSKIHIISYNKERLIDQSRYEEGNVPVFKSKEEIQQEITAKQIKLTTAKKAEEQATNDKANSQKALNIAKNKQAAAEKEVIDKKETLAKSQGTLIKSTNAYKEKVRQTTQAEDQLKATNERLAKINNLIVNRTEVLKQSKAKVNEAKAIEATSATRLKAKQNVQKREEAVLTTLTDNLNQSQEALVMAKNNLVTSQKALERLENAQSNYEEAVKALEKAKITMNVSETAYKDSVVKLGTLKESQRVAQEVYDQAEAKLIDAQQALEKVTKELEAKKSQQAEEQRKENLQKQVAEEQQRLLEVAKNKASQPVALALANNTNNVKQVQGVQLAKKEAMKGQARSEYHATKNQASEAKLFPRTGENTQYGVILNLLGLLLGLIGFAGFDIKRRVKKS